MIQSTVRRQICRSALSVLLCGTIAGSGIAAPSLPVTRETRARVTRDWNAFVLSRFTFGARQVDAAAIQADGANAWFERQLSPKGIDDSALEERLAAYPALRMTEAERTQRYPGPALIREMARNGIRLPSDPEQRAILVDQVEFYQSRREAQARQQTDVAPSAQGATGPQQTLPSAKVSGSPESGTSAGRDQEKLVPLEQTIEAMAKPRVDALLRISPAARFQSILAFTPEDLLALRKGARGEEAKLTEGMTPLQKETLLALSGTNRMLLNEVDGARLLRDIYSERQVEEVMTDFWLNHFNVYDRKNQEMPSLLPAYEATIRMHALGHFEDLLVAVATSPAMMLYLDNAGSTGPGSKAAYRVVNGKPRSLGLNENYARELMELHTLGVGGGYTQRDVTEVAKVFTGWTVDRGDHQGVFLYNDRRHEPGTKQVLGKTISEDGQGEGREVLHMLATSPATAHFLCGKLAQRFVADTPSPALVERMAQSFLLSDGDISTVLRTLYRSPEFRSPAIVHAKLKTPLEYVVSAVRVSGADVQEPAPLVQALGRLGMPLYGAQPPTGYKWDASSWLSTSALVNRMNFALSFSTDRIGGTRVDWTSTVPAERAHRQSASVGAEQALQVGAEQALQEKALEHMLLGTDANPKTRRTVLDQASDELARKAAANFQSQPGAVALAHAAPRGTGQGSSVPIERQADTSVSPIATSSSEKAVAAMAGLLLGSPEFQRR